MTGADERRTEEDGGRIGAYSGEEGEWSDVGDSVDIDGGDEGDGPGDDESRHELVGLEDFNIGGIDGAHGGGVVRTGKGGWHRHEFRLNCGCGCAKDSREVANDYVLFVSKVVLRLVTFGCTNMVCHSHSGI